MFAPRQSTATWLAVLLAACVLLLGFAAHSPGLHERLCVDAHEAHLSDSCDHPDDHSTATTPPSDHHSAHTSPDHDHACAVTLFAAGCETPVIFTHCPPLALHAEGVANYTELLLSRTLRGPERVCGPPRTA